MMTGKSSACSFPKKNSEGAEIEKGLDDLPVIFHDETNEGHLDGKSRV